MDYRVLDTVMKSDTFLLPRIDDLLGELGSIRLFSALNLASGFWQVRIHLDSRAKTAYVTLQGLHEFTVMPFGLTIVWAGFQYVMEKVLMDLNTKNGADIGSVYIDDIILYTETLE